jgi:ubiquinone/menaquinone biosynthesis C-methylase UbiE
MLEAVDYDDKQHAGYSQGRGLIPGELEKWMRAFAEQAPAGRPLTMLDLGSGTGRFTAALAGTFGGPTDGVEPSQKMRAVAESSPHPPSVSFLAGQAEAIPLADHSCDLVLMFLSFHHVRDRAAAAAEIARVLKPGGRVFIRSTFFDRAPEIEWHRYFPSARGIEMQMFPELPEVLEVFAAVGLTQKALVQVPEVFAVSWADNAERLKRRAISTFDFLSEAEIVAGFARMDADVAAETDPKPVTSLSDLLVLG